MDCPKCQKPLTVSRLEAHLGCNGCEQCEGVLLNLITYRVWRETNPAEVDACEVTPDPAAANTKHALLCPKCQRLMVKFKFATDLSHALDVCSHCEEVWLDRGEWDYLKERDIHGDLPRVFTDPWQRRLRQARNEVSLEKIWTDKLGSEDHQRVKEVARWLEDHPQRALLMGYLNSEDPYQP